MTTAFIGIGSNLGNRRRHIVTAAAKLAERAGDVLTISRMYETKPWGFESSNLFLNVAVKLNTELSPDDLLSEMKQIEVEEGRETYSDKAYHDRPVDIDILLYGDLIMRTDALVIPHPLMQQRRFVMEPMAEIAPSVVHPVLKKTMHELLETLIKEEA